jgi:hypothetical protein
MQETLQSLSVCFLLGCFVGWAYCSGACLTLGLYRFTGKSVLALVALVAVCVYFDWQKFAFAGVIALGISSSVLVRLSYLQLILPPQLARRSSRPGEEEPGIGVVEGNWTLCYSNGQTMSYDKKGKLCRIGFPDGSSWELSEQDGKPSGQDGTQSDQRDLL